MNVAQKQSLLVCTVIYILNFDRDIFSPREDNTTYEDVDKSRSDSSVIVSTDGYAKYNASANDSDKQYQELNDPPASNDTSSLVKHTYINAMVVNATEGKHDENAYEHIPGDGNEPYAAVC